MNKNKIIDYIDSNWENSIIPTIKEYIKIPNKSPAFDPKWEENGHMEEVLNLTLDWIEDNNNENFKLQLMVNPTTSTSRSFPYRKNSSKAEGAELEAIANRDAF